MEKFHRAGHALGCTISCFLMWLGCCRGAAEPYLVFWVKLIWMSQHPETSTVTECTLGSFLYWLITVNVRRVIPHLNLSCFWFFATGLDAFQCISPQEDFTQYIQIPFQSALLQNKHMDLLQSLTARLFLAPLSIFMACFLDDFSMSSLKNSNKKMSCHISVLASSDCAVYKYSFFCHRGRMLCKPQRMHVELLIQHYPAESQLSRI